MKKLNKIALYLYFIVVFIELVALIVSGIIGEFTGANFLEAIFSIITILLSPIFFLCPFYAFVLFTNSGKKYGKISNLKAIDFNTQKDYYRDIIKNYSMLELSLIDTYKINYQKDVISTLLALELKKKITIKNDKIEVIDNSLDSLKESEKYIIKNICDNKVSIKPEELTNIVTTEVVNDELSRKEVFSDYLKKIIIMVLIIVIFYILNKNKELIPCSNIVFDFIYAIVDLYGKYIIICLIGFVIGFLVSKKNSYIRTSKGEELNIKLEGLKIFLRDFSVMSERTKEELILWDSYLVYSVLFNQNKKIINDMSKYVNIIK